jgi:hypothetical protein
MNDDTITKEIGERKFKFTFMNNRFDLLFGTIFIGIGLIVFIFALLGESPINALENSQWIMLGIYMTGVICIVTGIIGFIAALIPKKP